MIYFYTDAISYWAENDAIYYLTQTDQELRIDLTDFEGDKAYALYSTFKVGDESTKYQLTVSGNSGNAGMYAFHINLVSYNLVSHN
jgi:hypothetical protein